LKKTVIALVGRPNVGKSTLFNRIIGKSQAVVHDRPGVTRDRIYAEALLDDRSFVVIDTGGLNLSPDDDLIASVKSQVDVAVKEADAIVFVVDVVDGITSWDAEIADKLRKSGKPIYVAVNKADNFKRGNDALEFSGLGFSNIFSISAIHGIGVDDLLEEILFNLPVVSEEPADTRRPIKIAVVGRPNVGKSSIVNSILGEERVIVDSRPGTTRDAINIRFSREAVEYEIVDTAGMRKRKKIYDEVESSSISKAIQAIRQSDVVWMVLDATQQPGQQDKEISTYVANHGRACIFVMNKWDLVEKDHKTFDEFSRFIRRDMALFDYIPIISVSALDNLRVKKILDLTQIIFAEYSTRVSTSTLNKAFGEITSEYFHPLVAGKRPMPKYITQVSTNPPTFVIFTSYAELIKQPYKRYVENRLREAFSFQGSPIVLHFRSTSKSEESHSNVKNNLR
jgi:GTP-binding protein